MNEKNGAELAAELREIEANFGDHPNANESRLASMVKELLARKHLPSGDVGKLREALGDALGYIQRNTVRPVAFDVWKSALASVPANPPHVHETKSDGESIGCIHCGKTAEEIKANPPQVDTTKPAIKLPDLSVQTASRNLLSIAKQQQEIQRLQSMISTERARHKEFSERWEQVRVACGAGSDDTVLEVLATVRKLVETPQVDTTLELPMDEMRIAAIARGAASKWRWTSDVPISEIEQDRLTAFIAKAIVHAIAHARKSQPKEQVNERLLRCVGYFQTHLATHHRGEYPSLKGEIDNAIRAAESAAVPSMADELAEALRDAYKELNEIHARDGVPYTHSGIKAGVTQEWFTSVVETARAVLERFDTKRAESCQLSCQNGRKDARKEGGK